ncbi:Methyltransferase [Candidatus Desulfarcum epimagneticum]|uniref:Methyltransferase n=1 Tax=uncultured Desulfobacteraceae bacterium TaxID=218296 RepID=A0A484HJU0_9BACT|nr:Methyltransferase [uncultured Desulfobacteraceae bacterium]
MALNKICFLCGNNTFVVRSGSVRDNDKLKVLECSDCGLVFLSSFDHITEKFYDNSKMHDGDLLEIDVWLKETEWDDERRFQFLKSLLPNKKVLDFGCGPAGFMLKARKLTKFIRGVELEKRLRNHYDKNRLYVVHNLSELPKDESYDLITMFHTLEHIPDPKNILTQLKPLLSKNGQIVVEVPNANDALLTLYNSKAFSDFTYWSCHLFLFTTSTLGKLLKHSGFKINYIKQTQRYSLANHVFWLSNKKPGGHQKWHFLDSPQLHSQYEKMLCSIGKCDTIIGSFSVKQ